jgi:hypothetical protein
VCPVKKAVKAAALLPHQKKILGIYKSIFINAAVTCNPTLYFIKYVIIIDD